MKTKILTFIVLMALVICLPGCADEQNAIKQNTANSTPPAKIKVAAAEKFYGEVAQAVGDDQVDVISILTNPDQDPHEYEPTAEASRTVADAQVVIYTGIGYDDWMDKFIKADSSAGTKYVVNVATDILGKASGDNPHIWYDPATMPKLAEKLASDLAKLDPGHASDYTQRAQAYISSLAPLNDKIARLKQSTPMLIDVSEPVFGYMADALNFKTNDPKFAKAIEEGNDPSASDVIQVQNDIKNKRIKFFVYNIQTDSPTVKNIVQLAESNGVPLVRVTETEPSGKNYMQWMSEQLDQVSQALGISN
jgi:zinc/manganese transport system substrate-binding protein